MNRNYFVLAIGALVLFGILMRFVPHMPNATPIAAIAIVSSLYLGKKWAIILPVAVLLLSDVMIGMYDWRIMLSVYGSFVLIGCISWVCKKYNSFLSIGASVISSSLIFFLITNSAVWLFSPWYEKTISGLFYSFELGIPFLRNMLIGDIVYSVTLIAVFETVFVISTMKRFATKTT